MEPRFLSCFGLQIRHGFKIRIKRQVDILGRQKRYFKFIFLGFQGLDDRETKTYNTRTEEKKENEGNECRKYRATEHTVLIFNYDINTKPLKI